MATQTQRYQNQKSLVGLGVLLGLAWFLVSFNTARAVGTDTSLFAKVVAAVIPTALALALVAGAYCILFYELYEHVLAIAKWTVFGLCAFTFAVVLNLLVVDSVPFNYTLVLYVLLNASAGGAVLGLLVGLYNARQRRLEAELTAEHERALTLSQRLNVINRVLRHDTRNQAQIIQCETDRLLNGEASPAASAAQIQDANDRLTELAAQARKLETMLGADGATQETLDLCTLVERASESVKERHPALTLDTDLPDDCPVVASPLLEDAIVHLLRNAAEHNHADEPHADITLTADESAALPVALSIADTGPGMPDTEPLYGDEPDMSQLRHSSGFGLWFVKWVVEDAAGDISVRTPTDSNTGTVVTIRLPDRSGQHIRRL
jgi:two-component system OmpR family sensor kinase